MSGSTFGPRFFVSMSYPILPHHHHHLGTSIPTLRTTMPFISSGSPLSTPVLSCTLTWPSYSPTPSFTSTTTSSSPHRRQDILLWGILKRETCFIMCTGHERHVSFGLEGGINSTDPHLPLSPPPPPPPTLVLVVMHMIHPRHRHCENGGES